MTADDGYISLGQTMDEECLFTAVATGREEDVERYLTTSQQTSTVCQTQLDSALVKAVEEKRANIMELLINAGASLDQTIEKPNAQPKTLLMTAFTTGDQLTLVTFLRHFKGNITDQLEAENNETVLNAAIRSANLDFVKQACSLLQDNKIDVDKLLQSKYNTEHPLHTAIWVIVSNISNASSSATGKMDCSTGSDLSILEYLLEQGLDVNYRDSSGRTLLHHMACAGQLDAVRVLMRYGPNLSIWPYYFGSFAWVEAAESKHHQIMEYLIDAEDLTTPDFENYDLNLGVQYFHEACKSGSVPAVKYLQGKGVDVNCLNRYDLTPLMTAAIENKPDVIKYLLEETLCDVNFMTEDQTALGYAVMPLDRNHGHHPWASEDAVKVLLEAGADINIRDSNGYTMLMDENIFLVEECRQLLLRHGADINAVAPDGLNVLWLAFNWYDSQCSDGIFQEFFAWNVDIGLSQYQHDGRTPLQHVYCAGDHEHCELLLDAGCSLRYVQNDLHASWDWDDDGNDNRGSMLKIQQRIKEMCSVPYTAKDHARRAILRVIGQGKLAEKIHQLYRAKHLPKFLANYLGKTINLAIDD